MFAAVAGDFSPLTIDASNGEARLAPPALLIAVAVGLGSMDMPIPQVSTWEWLSWKFPKAVRAGETIYARWTLTQKRPPVHGAKTGIAVWRVDLHTADGAMCAEGEVGAAVVRRGAAAALPTPDRGEATAASGPRRRRRRRTGTADAPAAAAPVPSPAAPAPAAERAPRRRRRGKRGSGSGGNGNGGNGGEQPAQAAAAPAPSPPPAPAITAPAPPTNAQGTISRVMRRLRRT